jgi:hypothetical protein
MQAKSGLYLSPIIGALCGNTMLVLLSGVLPNQIFDILFVYTLIASIIGWAIAVVIGWPLFLIFERFGFRSLWQHAIGGALCALPFWLLWSYSLDSGTWLAHKYVNTFYIFSVGISSAIAFWIFVVRPTLIKKSFNYTTDISNS